MLMVIKEELHR